MITTKQCLLVVLSMLVLMVCEARSFGQKKNASELLDRKLTVHLSHATLIYVIDTLAQDHEIPIGLEKSPNEADEAKIDIDVEKGSLREVLDAIVHQEPTYRWVEIEGVINFTPTDLRYGFVVTLLDTPVSRFAPAKGNDKSKIRSSILELPEVGRAMTSNGVAAERFSNLVYRAGVHDDDHDVDLSISNTNVRGVLNKVIRDSKHKTWVVELTGKNKENLLVSF